MTNFQPFGERVLVRVITPEEKTAGGLLVAPVSKELSNRGEVIAVGEGTTLADGTIKPLSIKVGDTVIFSLGVGTSYSSEKEDYKILSVRDILGRIIEGDTNE